MDINFGALIGTYGNNGNVTTKFALNLIISIILSMECNEIIHIISLTRWNAINFYD